MHLRRLCFILRRFKMSMFGEKQHFYLKNYVLDNLHRKQYSDRQTYDYMIPIGNGFIYVRIRRSSVVLRTRFLHLTSYDMDFYWALKYPKLTKLWDKIKFFWRKVLRTEAP